MRGGEPERHLVFIESPVCCSNHLDSTNSQGWLTPHQPRPAERQRDARLRTAVRRLYVWVHGDCVQQNGKVCLRT